MAHDLQAALRLTTRVGPGHKIEVIAPQLIEGEAVEVFVVATRPADEPKQAMVDFLDSLPRGPRSASTWDEFERQFQEERNAWDR